MLPHLRNGRFSRYGSGGAGGLNASIGAATKQAFHSASVANNSFKLSGSGRTIPLEIVALSL
jgi:hypothetical protein